MNLTDEQLLQCSNAGATAATAALEGGSTAMFVSNRYNPEYDSEARLAFARAAIETARSFDPPPLEWISVRERMPTAEDGYCAKYPFVLIRREDGFADTSPYNAARVAEHPHWLPGKALEALPVRPEPAPVDPERELFEAWFIKELPRANMKREASRDYEHPVVAASWQGWQARAAQP